MRCIANRRDQAEYPVTATTKREGKGREGKGDPESFRRGLSHLIGCSRCHVADALRRRDCVGNDRFGQVLSTHLPRMVWLIPGPNRCLRSVQIEQVFVNEAALLGGELDLVHVSRLPQRWSGRPCSFAPGRATATCTSLGLDALVASEVSYSTEWKAAANTPWTERMRPHFRDHLRFECRRYTRAG